MGIRTPWTLESDAVYFLLVPVLGTIVITVAYSYVLYEKLERAA